MNAVKPIRAHCSRSRRSTAAHGVGILTLAAGVLTVASAAEWQTAESIRAAARDYVHARLGVATVVEAVGIDDRVRLPLCSEPLAASAQSELRNGNGTVAVSCGGVQPWRLYVPVRAVAQAAAVVTRRALQAGAAITADDVVIEQRSTAALPYEYVTDPALAVGATARRPIPAGTVLVPAALRRTLAIERGALVTLVAKHGGVVVKTEGVALEPARLDDRVRVRSPSGRVVEGVAAALNEVHVGS